MNAPKLRLNLGVDAQESAATERVKSAAKKKAEATESIDEAWARILAMKNSESDQARLIEVKNGMDAGLIGREPASVSKRFSKAEALRLWRQLQEQQRANTLRKMVEETPANYWLITDERRMDEFLSILAKESEIVFDVETTGPDTYEDFIVGNVLTAVNANIHAYIPTKHATESKQLPHEYVMGRLKPFYEDENLGKLAHNSKFDIHMLAKEGIELKGLTWDTMVAMHILNENERQQGGSYRLKDLVTKYLKVPSETYDTLFGKKGFHEVSDLRIALAYAAKDGDVTLKLRDFQRRYLDKIGLTDYYVNVENPTIGVSIEMEQAGFAFDSKKAEELSKHLNAELVGIEKGLHEHFGDINFNSPTQLSALFFDKLKLDRFLPKGFKKSTDVSTLKILSKHNDGIKLLLDYREKTKLLGTYVDAMPKLVRSDGRIHGSYNQSGTVTGRFSSNNPNLQNFSKDARKMFIPPEGLVLLSGDFSQQEPRWLSHFTQESVLVNAYREGKDLYATTASELFDIPIEECGDGSKWRKMMKVGILAVMYGVGPKTLADQLSITETEAKAFVADFYKAYPRVKAWIDGNEAFAKKHGYVEMFMGRKRRLPEAKSRDRGLQFRALRQATNAIIQGSAAIQTKLTMIEIQRLCMRKGWQMAWTCHDECGVYAPETITIEDVKEFESVFLNTVKLRVPNKTDIEISRRWGAGYAITEWFKQNG